MTEQCKYTTQEYKISEIDFDKYSIDLKPFDKVEKNFFMLMKNHHRINK